jgi:hypothetical protein
MIMLKGLLKHDGISVQKVSWKVAPKIVCVAAVIRDQSGLRRWRQQDCAPGRRQLSPEKLFLLLGREPFAVRHDPGKVILLLGHEGVMRCYSPRGLPAARHGLVDSATAPKSSSCC